jgi:hypothetical protein
MRFRIALIASLGLQAVVFAGEAATEQGKQALAKGAQTWAGFDIFGCSLNLRNDREVEWYLFHRDGSVSVTLGEKNRSTAAPLWFWRISGKWLQILDEDGKLVFQKRPLKVSATELVVDNGRGETEVFEIQYGTDKRTSVPQKK